MSQNLSLITEQMLDWLKVHAEGKIMADKKHIVINIVVGLVCAFGGAYASVQFTRADSNNQSIVKTATEVQGLTKGENRILQQMNTMVTKSDFDEFKNHNDTQVAVIQADIKGLIASVGEIKGKLDIK